MTLGNRSAKPAKFHTTKRFGRRLKGWADYLIMLPRWFYLLLLFFSGWGVSSITKQIVEAIR